MSNSSVNLALPNPYTPLAFLPPELANQLEVYRYVVVATLGAFIWNFLSHVDSHYKLLFRNRITLATVAYFTSIIGTAIYLSCCVAFHIGTIGNCQALTTGLASAYVVIFPATSVLFLLRVHAVFTGHKGVMIFFVFCWLGVLGSSITLPFALFGAHIGPTSHCIDSGVKPFSSAGVFASTVFDSLVFFAITGRLLDNAMTGNGFREKARTFFVGGALPALSRALLYSGQVYYLITMCSNIATVALILTPSVPPLFHALLTLPNSALTCMMACKIYTDLKFQSHHETSSFGFSSSFLPAQRQTIVQCQPNQMFPYRTEPVTDKFQKLTFNGLYPTREGAILQQGIPEAPPLSDSSSTHYSETRYDISDKERDGQFV